MQRTLNIKNFNVFVQKVKGAQVTEISVARVADAKGVRLKYSAKDPRTRQIFNGEWRTGPAAPDSAEEKEFFALAEKEFAVKRQTQ